MGLGLLVFYLWWYKDRKGMICSICNPIRAMISQSFVKGEAEIILGIGWAVIYFNISTWSHGVY